MCVCVHVRVVFVSILRKLDANWLEGMLNDKKGIFPLAYVEMVAEDRDWGGGCVSLLANVECEPVCMCVSEPACMCVSESDFLVQKG